MASKKESRPKLKLLLTERSKRDLKGVQEYPVRTYGQSVAEDYLNGFQNTLDLLIETPGILRPMDGFPEQFKYYRMKKQIMVFDHDKSRLVLLTVFHGSMDIVNNLKHILPTLAVEVASLRRQVE